jgi:hypothetical protein
MLNPCGGRAFLRFSALPCATLRYCLSYALERQSSLQNEVS